MAALRRFKVIVAYDGSNYQGWQKQPNDSSIQETIESVLSKIHERAIEIVGSGRTDAKVHAIAQVFHFDSDKRMEAQEFKFALNRLLPKDIRIKDVEEVDQEFHARFSVKSKRYDYLVSNDMFNPFIQNYMEKDKYVLDVAFMNECASIFIGTHDFTSFTSSKMHPDKSRIKTMYELYIVQEKDYVRLVFIGDGFLRYMIRMIAQVLIEAGKYKISKEEIKAVLEKKDKEACSYKANPCGLYLIEVTY